MRCKKIKNQLFLYIGNDLPEKERKSVDSHLLHCPACREELERLRKIQAGVRSIAQKDVPDMLDPQFPEKIVQEIAGDTGKPSLGKDKLHTWLFQSPLRAAGIMALVIFIFTAAVVLFLPPRKTTLDKIAAKLLSVPDRGSPELDWDPDHIFFKTFEGPYKIDSWEAPDQSGVYALMHKTPSAQGATTYVIDYCGQGRKLSAYRGYPWIQHRLKRLISRAGSKENIYIAVFLMPDSSKQDRLQIEEALLQAFNPYFNRGA